jgi:hypothetical protein
MNPVTRGLVRIEILTLFLCGLYLAVSTAHAIDPRSHSPLFKPWINGVEADEPHTYILRATDCSNRPAAAKP